MSFSEKPEEGITEYLGRVFPQLIEEMARLTLKLDELRSNQEKLSQEIRSIQPGCSCEHIKTIVTGKTDYSMFLPPPPMTHVVHIDEKRDKPPTDFQKTLFLK